MAKNTPPFKGSNSTWTRIRGAFWGCGLSVACWCVPPASSAHPPDAQAVSSITEISLERDCSGCANGSRLVLRRDGTALLTIIGKGRLGTEDRVSKGMVRVQDFDALARLALRHGFFALKDEYQDPSLQDGAWATTRVLRGTQDKQVFSREDAGPADLKSFTAAIDALKTRIAFVPSLP